ncbi:MAG: glycosyl transferase family 2 [Deltaproteobacteria bacterium]|jgi:hypothetical protein|nr:glycosyl transferase family 2 [Deltaproteobacteria bacterium]
MTKLDTFISVVIVLGRNSIAYSQTIQEIQRCLSNEFSDYEIIVIGNGQIKKFDAMEALLHDIPCIRYIQLSASVHREIAIAAGLENSIGDFSILFDYQKDPIDIIRALVDLGMSGNDIVVGTAQDSRSSVYRLGRLLMTRPLKAIGYEIPPNATALRCLSRRAVNAITANERFQYQLYSKIHKTGYQCAAYEYSQMEDGVPDNKSFFMGLRNFLHLMVFNSLKPLRWISILGFAGSTVAFIFASYSVILHLFTGYVATGWTTMVFFMSFFFMIQFVILVFIGEYIGRLLIDRSEQTEYAIAFERNSTVMVDMDRINVLNESVSVVKNMSQTGRNM